MPQRPACPAWPREPAKPGKLWQRTRSQGLLMALGEAERTSESAECVVGGNEDPRECGR